jgi:hypothetical protein
LQEQRSMEIQGAAWWTSIIREAEAHQQCVGVQRCR